MAEYIDKQELIRLLDNIRQPRRPIIEGFKYITIDEAIRVVQERPTADVVEGKKIDWAFKEMQYYSAGFYYMGKRDLADAVENCIKILRRNIGENDGENE